ncbi:hypothetical protein FHETE_5998 [Fusarium heterosporum]|uniref:Apple domain-containing protein n=1 Tax=Fusarium heterosporum TaxID=42747 RepID=A0A8H5WQJ3_FUSHE|nr:hypothetical protein FHETE_5998 [Fusarium heterosporum]
MARRFVHSFILAAVLSPLVSAGPCRPSSSSAAVTTTEQSTSIHSALSTDTGITVSETASATTSDDATATEQSTLTGSDLSTETAMTVSESDTTTATCTPADPPVFTETEEFMMSSMFEDPTTTAAAEATPTSDEPFECVDNLKQPSPTGAYCGAKGYVQTFSENYKYLGDGSAASVLDCYKSCMEKPNCVTFYFEENNYCQLYKGAITSFVQETEANYEWYETKCFCDTDIEPAPTCEDVNPIINGGWDNGRFTPWDYYSYASGREVVDFKIKEGGADDSAYRFQTGNFHFDKSMWLYQDIKACPGARFSCTFKWWWDKYYAIDQGEDDDGDHVYLVPYVRIYQDDDSYALTSEYPRSDADTMKWMPGDFRFTVPSSGETRIWYIASSPQGEWINTSDDPCNPEWVHRPNALALDSMICYPN